MTLDDILKQLNIEDAREIIAPGWRDAMACLPPDDPAFLAPTFIQEACAYCTISDDIAAQAVRAAGRIATDPALRALLWHWVHRTYGDGPKTHEWPLLADALGNDAGMFYLLGVMSNYRVARQVHERHGVPADVVAATMGNIRFQLNRHKERQGAWGVEPLYAGGWLTNHFTGIIYNLGRLQYIARPFPQQVVVFRHRETGRVLALAEDGIEFRRDGQCNGASGITETDGVWQGRLKMTSSCVMGNPIDPARAAAQRATITLRRSDWEMVLEAGDPTIEMHIPAGDPLTPEACADSVAQAAEFFPKHFPEDRTPKAIKCSTWLLDPHFEDWLDDDSNILAFQREFYLWPSPCDPWSALRFVFGLDIQSGWEGELDLSSLPQNTRLERALVEHVRKGGRWKRSAGFFLLEDLPWGRRVYRR